ncbi:carbohydrate-binding module family 24 protein [Lophiostoma macrostomum CBS 122681]|uniref:Carbohydrate-binding module family 24 protein n=1 Tax=Lophiostoma macrostomum CBS 122681 TaxID=1314788 RepID=A0A6A6SLX7_9PLEO|nr:carbohydrate-binding module family 24 protein [Lophiostoma macrostomum CBS 122681]
MRSLLSVGVLCSLFGLRASGKAVFAHFMIGNTENYGSPDFESEISQAQEAHIDGFALNFAYADYTNDGSIERMFGAAERKGFKLIFSFDYAGNGPFPKEEVDYWLDMYLGSSAYFHHSTGQPLVSTFEGPESADDWIELKKKHNVFFMPSYSSLGAKEAMKTGVPDGLFSWAAWPKGPNDMTTEVDSSYCEFLDKIDCRGGKPYMMPVSPWFYTRIVLTAADLPGYDKNWLWRGDSLWFDRWTHAWTVQPEYVQIISWNDYGESHHIGDVREDALVAFDVGEAPFNYARGRPHAAWRMFLPYVIDIYKVGEAAISKEGISVWYHTNQGRACSSGGTTGNTAAQVQVEGQPADFSQDKIFVSALLGSTANLQIKIGDGSWDVISWDTTPDGNSGLYFGSTPFTGQGQVQVRVMRGPDQVVGLTGAAIDNTSRGCVGGFTNWNAWVGGTWASGGVSASSGDLSGCIRGTGDGDIKTLCEYACKYNYCPFGACTCTQRGKINNADKDAGKGAGYPNPGKECIYLGLCDYACDHGICPTNACNRDEANKGKCFIPPDTPPATPTKKPTTTAAPPEATDHGDPYAEDRDTWANHDKCWIYDPPNHEASVNQCLSGPCKKIVEDAEKEGRTTNYGCLGFWALDQPIPWEDDPSECRPAVCVHIPDYETAHIGKRTAVGRCQCDST